MMQNKVRSKHTDEWIRLSQRLAREDRLLAPIIEAVGVPTLRLERHRFRALAESILSQQLATKAAAAIIGRFTALEKPFPRPERVLKLSPRQFQSCGVSGQKSVYLKELARAWQKDLAQLRWAALSDEAIIEHLVAVKGIGEWTAQMFLIFSLGRVDVLPTGDFGIRRGVQLLFRLSEMPHPRKMAELVPHWKGASSVASWYLWRALDRKILVQS